MQISVVIPIHNGSQYLERCLQSIINQNISCEIIIIDDASTDNLYETLCNIKNKLNIEPIYIKNEINLGPAQSRNKGVSIANGDYIAFLDVDDWWEHNKLIKQIQFIQETKADFVYTARRNIYKNGTKELHCMEKVCYNDLLKNNHITTSSVLIKKDLMLKFPMAHDELCEDYYTWLLILKHIPFAYGIDEPLVNYYVHKNSLSSNKIKNAMKRYKVYKLMDIPFMKRLYSLNCYMLSGIFKYVNF